MFRFTSVALPLALAACSTTLDVIARAPDASHAIEAIHAQPETGATVGFVEHVYVVAAGESPHGDPVFVADHLDGPLGMIWSGDELTISARRARVFKAKPEVRVATRAGLRVVRVKTNIAEAVD